MVAGLLLLRPVCCFSDVWLGAFCRLRQYWFYNICPLIDW